MIITYHAIEKVCIKYHQSISWQRVPKRNSTLPIFRQKLSFPYSVSLCIQHYVITVEAKATLPSIMPSKLNVSVGCLKNILQQAAASSSRFSIDALNTYAFIFCLDFTAKRSVLGITARYVLVNIFFKSPKIHASRLSNNIYYNRQVLTSYEKSTARSEFGNIFQFCFCLLLKSIDIHDDSIPIMRMPFSTKSPLRFQWLIFRVRLLGASMQFQTIL